MTIRRLLSLLAKYKGSIVSTASLSIDEIKQARAANRMSVDERGLGFVWEPLYKFPETEEEAKLFDTWFPLEVELPEELKTADFIFKKRVNPQDN